jgi:hypothetical protein
VEDSDAEWLILVLGDRLRLALPTGASPASFTVDGVWYRDTGDGELTAFHDRLEDRSGRLAGVRVNPTGGGEWIGRLPSAADLTRPSDLHAVDVSFRPNADGPVTCTGDQAFGAKWFVASGGTIAMSLDFTCLSAGEADRRALLESGADWAHAIR